MTKITLTQEDITLLAFDAVITSANITLLGGGGVDGKIHLAAGEGLRDECRKLGGCKVGEAKITGGHNLPAKHVIHAVGPLWKGGIKNEQALLRSAYTFALQVAQSNGIKTIAFPNIATNIYGFPKLAAAEIAIGAVNDFCVLNPSALDEIRFVCFDDENYSIYNNILGKQVTII